MSTVFYFSFFSYFFYLTVFCQALACSKSNQKTYFFVSYALNINKTHNLNCFSDKLLINSTSSVDLNQLDTLFSSNETKCINISVSESFDAVTSGNCVLMDVVENLTWFILDDQKTDLLARGKDFDSVSSVDNCQNVQGFVVNDSVDGGTGSGLGVIILEKLAVESICEPYCAFLTTYWQLDHFEISVLVYDICQKQLVYMNLKSLRFEGEMNVDLNEFQTNLVPFPRLHFITTGMAPILPKSKQDTEKADVQAIADQCFQPGQWLVKISDFDSKEDKYMAISLNYRSNNACVNASTTPTDCPFISSTQIPTTNPTAHPSSTKITITNDINNFNSTMNPALPSTINPTSYSASFALEGEDVITDEKNEKVISTHWYVGEDMEEDVAGREDFGFLEKDYMDVLSETKIGDEVDEEDRSDLNGILGVSGANIDSDNAAAGFAEGEYEFRPAVSDVWTEGGVKPKTVSTTAPDGNWIGSIGYEKPIQMDIANEFGVEPKVSDLLLFGDSPQDIPNELTNIIVAPTRFDNRHLLYRRWHQTAMNYLVRTGPIVGTGAHRLTACKLFEVRRILGQLNNFDFNFLGYNDNSKILRISNGNGHIKYYKWSNEDKTFVLGV